MIKKYFPVVIFIVFMFQALIYAGEDNLPEKVYIGDIKSPAQIATEAYVLKEKIRSILSVSTNIVLIQEYQATNFKDISDQEKFISLNNLNGLIAGEITRENGKSSLILNATGRQGRLETYKIEYSSLDEGINELSRSFITWAEGVFPMLQKSVIVKEEVETVTIGKFEYTKPALLAEAGLSYDSFAITGNSFTFTTLAGPYADLSLRYSWWALNAGIKWESVLGQDNSGSSIFYYAGPGVNILKGLLTISLDFGLGNTKVNDRVSDTNNQTELDYGLLILVFEANVTENYGLSLGLLLGEGNLNSDFLTNSQNSKTTIFGGLIKNSIKITPDLGIALRYMLEIDWENDEGQVFSVGSDIYLGLTYKFNFGAAND